MGEKTTPKKTNKQTPKNSGLCLFSLKFFVLSIFSVLRTQGLLLFFEKLKGKHRLSPLRKAQMQIVLQVISLMPNLFEHLCIKASRIKCLLLLAVAILSKSLKMS